MSLFSFFEREKFVDVIMVGICGEGAGRWTQPLHTYNMSAGHTLVRFMDDAFKYGAMALSLRPEFHTLEYHVDGFVFVVTQEMIIARQKEQESYKNNDGY